MEKLKIIKAQTGTNIPVLRQNTLPVQRPTTDIVKYKGFPRWFGRLSGPLAAVTSILDLEQKRKEIARQLQSGEAYLDNGQIKNKSQNSVASGVKVGAIVAKKSKEQFDKNQTTNFLNILRKGWRKDENGNWITPERDRVVSSKKNADGTRTVTPRIPYQSKQPVTQESIAPKQPVKSQQQTTSQQTSRQQQRTSSFGQAFAQARKQGLSEFTWNGGRYTTQLAEEKRTSNNQRNLRNKINFQIPTNNGELTLEDQQRLNNAQSRTTGSYKQGGLLISRKNTIQKFKQRQKK